MVLSPSLSFDGNDKNLQQVAKPAYFFDLTQLIFVDNATYTLIKYVCSKEVCMKGLKFDNFDDFAICLNKMRYDVQKNMSDALKPFGLSSMHSLYIMTLYHEGGMTLASLSKALCFNRANTTRVVRDLMQKGYVDCDKESENQRKFNVFLSEQGKIVADKLHQSMEKGRREQESKLTTQEWQTLIELMHKLAD